MSTSRRTTFRLSLECSNRCIFCAQDGLTDPEGSTENLGERLAALRADADELTFVGGEPTIHPDLPAAIAAARRAGFARVGIQTNGRRLGEAGFTQAMAAAGLTDVHLSIHGADAPVHDYHTGRDGSFTELVAGLASARASSLAVVAVTVLTRSSFRALGGLPLLLQGLGVSAWLIEIPNVAGRAVGGFDRVVPRLGLALPFALHAMDAARRLSLPAWIRGAPACALGPFASRALPDRPRAYAEACDGCASRPVCPGLDPTYLQRFGGDELRQRELPSAFEGEPAELARMFVGVGELVTTARSAAIPTPPATARRSLPILERVKPARAEVGASTPKRSGEALREILPQLFDKKTEPGT